MFSKSHKSDRPDGKPHAGRNEHAPAPAGAPGPGGEYNIEEPDAEPAGGGSAPGAAAEELTAANEKYLRMLADFQNYQRRALGNEKEARVQGATGVLTSVIPILDNFDLALGQDPGTASVAQIVEGVKAIREALLRALESHGVRTIAPGPNEEFDPSRHQAIMNQAADGIEPGHIVATFQAGYMLGDRVIRPAKVSVAPSD